MEVSRQSISKWEGALSVPDMNRILKLSELFDVSTDYLLRDEMEEEEKNPAADEKIADETGEKLVRCPWNLPTIIWLIVRRSLFPALLACFYVLCLRYFCFFFPAPEKRDCFR